VLAWRDRIVIRGPHVVEYDRLGSYCGCFKGGYRPGISSVRSPVMRKVVKSISAWGIDSKKAWTRVETDSITVIVGRRELRVVRLDDLPLSLENQPLCVNRHFLGFAKGDEVRDDQCPRSW
jgi:hypothetical protein